ncbi:MAG TPA: WhiB family transcriptional regulator [Nocardioidaceae bacterium]|nr:WhiB family transcriptional regulator [Nocardioidaceae bacterium]
MTARKFPTTAPTPRVTDRRDETPPGPCTRAPWVFDAVLDHTRGPSGRAAVKEAKAICGMCPAATKEKCLRENGGEPGVVAGLTVQERERRAA